MPERPAVIVVEDNLLISMEVQFVIEDCGCEVVGPAASCAEALALLETRRIAAAVLDINLGDERVWPVLDALDQYRLPSILVTGYSRADVPEEYRNRLILPKPLAPSAIRDGLRKLGVIDA